MGCQGADRKRTPRPLLERGKNIEHIKDYVNATKPPWAYPHRGGRTRDMVRRYPVLSRDYPLNETNLDFWVNEQESPYTEAKRFDWFRGYHVGGRSLMWGRCSFRWSDINYEENAKDGIAIDWPIRIRGHLAVVQSRRTVCWNSGLEGRAGSTSRRRISAGDAAQLRGRAGRRAADKIVRWEASLDL